MAKSKNIDWQVEDEVKEEAKPAPVKKAEVRYYRPVLWKGIKEVFKCEKCGSCRDDQDSIILHVLLHYPHDEQEELFDKLMKEK